MKKKENNYAYIDGANLHNGISGFDWQLVKKEKAPDADGIA